MLIRNDFEVAAPVDKVWQFFDNIPQVAACLPGTELTSDLGEDRYKGRVAVRMGPVRLQFAGKAEITERDETGKRVVVHAAGPRKRAGGRPAWSLPRRWRGRGAAPGSASPRTCSYPGPLRSTAGA